MWGAARGRGASCMAVPQHAEGPMSRVRPRLETRDGFYWYHNCRLIIKPHEVAIVCRKGPFLKKITLISVPLAAARVFPGAALTAHESRVHRGHLGRQEGVDAVQDSGHVLELQFLPEKQRKRGHQCQENVTKSAPVDDRSSPGARTPTAPGRLAEGASVRPTRRRARTAVFHGALVPWRLGLGSLFPCH